MKAKQVLEFHKTGDPLGSLGLGSDFAEILDSVKQELNDEIEQLKLQYYRYFLGFMQKSLIGKTITANINELQKFHKEEMKPIEHKRITGKHTFTVQDIHIDEHILDAPYRITSIIVADTENRIYNMSLEQKILVKK